IYNQLAHRNPYHGVKVYEEKTIYAPLASDDFGTDARFVGAVDGIKRSGVPFLVVHIPALVEIEGERQGEYAFGPFGVPPERERSLAESLDRVTGQPTVHLYQYYNAAVKRDPLSLVYSRDNSHPSPKGVDAMAEALERLVIETGVLTRPTVR